jgi:glycosyltransferase involved in cell wall biosynthesis
MVKITSLRPLVSIILPTYNRAKMLKCAVKSILKQHYKDWELIIVDNHSIDETEMIINQFNDDRIRLFKIQNGGSIGKSRNLGIRNAKGEWIAFIDSDDWWLPDKLTVCAEKFYDQVDLIYHDLLISDNGRILLWKKIRGKVLKSPIIIDLLIKGNVIANSSVIVRRSIFEKVGLISEDMNINPSVDLNTWLKIASATENFKYIPQALGGYLIHPGAESRRNMSISHEYAISNYIHLLSNNELIQVRRYIDYLSGRYEYLSKEDIIAEKALKKCLRHREIQIVIKTLFMLLIINLRKIRGYFQL